MCVSAFSNTHPFAPVIDRTFIREAPQQAVAEGRINGVISSKAYYPRILTLNFRNICLQSRTPTKANYS